jgi:hypothetical protein
MEHIGCVVESTVLQRVTVLHVISFICNYGSSASRYDRKQIV